MLLTTNLKQKSYEIVMIENHSNFIKFVSNLQFKAF